MANPYAPPGMYDGGYVPPGGPTGQGGPLSWELGEVLTHGWEILKRQPMLAVALFLMYMVPNLGSFGSSLLQQTGLFGDDSLFLMLITGSASLIAMVASIFLQVGLLRMFVAAARGQEASLGLLFSGIDRFLPMLGYSMLSGMAVLVGLIFLIVPGVILAIGLSLGQYFLIDQRQGVIQAMKSSWQATSGNKGDLFLFFLVGGGLTILGLCACFVGVFVTSSVVMAAMAIIYLRRSGQGSVDPTTMGPPGSPGQPAGYPPAGHAPAAGFPPGAQGPHGGY
jgi:hypothetical protein